jgi:hypothetical protein
MQPLVFSTEIAATFVEAGNVPPPASPGGTSSNLTDANRSSAVARQLFKRRLHGMINVRTDGKKIFAARRVSAGYWWEAYEPFDAEM